MATKKRRKSCKLKGKFLSQRKIICRYSRVHCFLVVVSFCDSGKIISLLSFLFNSQNIWHQSICFLHVVLTLKKNIPFLYPFYSTTTHLVFELIIFFIFEAVSHVYKALKAGSIFFIHQIVSFLASNIHIFLILEVQENTKLKRNFQFHTFSFTLTKTLSEMRYKIKTQYLGSLRNQGVVTLLVSSNGPGP